MKAESKYFRRRRLADFLQAIENEIVIDLASFELAGTHPETVGYYPRPGKWLEKIKNRSSYARWVWRWSAVLWRLGGSALFHFIQMSRGFRELGRDEDQSKKLVNVDNFALILSTRAGEIIGADSVDETPNCWITMPWAPISTSPPGVYRVSAFSLLTPRDLCLSLFDAVVATEAVARRRRSSAWILQTYTAFNWFAVRRAIERLGGRLVIAEHFDRWAILVDGVATSRKHRLPAVGDDRQQLVLVQHGAMGQLSATGQETGSCAQQLRLKRRLRGVTSLYVYDVESENAFKRNVLSAGCVARGISVKYFRPKIQLQPNPCVNVIRVLFVGHPYCDDLHDYVLEALTNSHPVRAFYKPHPLAQMNERMNKLDWTVIRDKTHFPEVDMLVSYPSTLVVEYAAWNVPAVVHPMDLKVSDAQEFIESAKKQLDTYLPHLANVANPDRPFESAKG